MSGMLSAVLVVFLTLALVGAPVMAAPAVGQSASLGVVLAAEQVHARPDLIYSGATIYDGDRLQTLSGGTLVARLGSGQMVLPENSSAIVHSAPHGFLAELESGSVVVSSGEGQSFQVMAAGATIRPLNAQPASAQITKLAAKELILTNLRGTLEVSAGGEVKIIEAGTSYRIEVQPGELGGSRQSSPTPPVAPSHLALVVVPVIGVVTVLVSVRALESGDRL